MPHPTAAAPAPQETEPATTGTSAQESVIEPDEQSLVEDHFVIEEVSMGEPSKPSLDYCHPHPCGPPDRNDSPAANVDLLALAVWSGEQ